MFNILVVEDEKVTNDLITYNLKEAGYEAIQAFNGAEAINLIKRFKFHLIITDIVMPEKDGYDLLRKIEDIHSESIPAVILSALSTDIDQLKGYEYSIEDYISKPFNSEILKKKINSIMKRLYNYTAETRIDYNEQSVKFSDQTISLSTKEFEVFEYLFVNKLKFCSKEEIYDYVWEGQENTSIRVVDYTVKRIRKKFEEHKNVIVTKVGVGYKYEE